MATEILRPQDVLAGRFRVHTPPHARRKNFPAKGSPAALTLNQNQQRRPSAKHEKRRSDAAAADAKKPNRGGDRRRSSSGALAMGNVTLLRRGESLDSLATKIGGSNSRDPTRSDSELVAPLKVRKAVPPPKVDVYAGAAFDSSPSPRCLPRPSFCGMKGGASDDDDATRSLRRMLGLVV